MELDELKEHIRNIPDFPKPGIVFRDITTLLLNPEAFETAVTELEKGLREKQAEKIAAIESRGFIFGAVLADRMDLGLILIRKSGKLPEDVHEEAYDLEYGTDTLEMHKDSVQPGERVLIIDDLLATGGTCAAAARLVRQAEGVIAGIGFVIELDALEGRHALQEYEIVSLIHY